MNRVQRAILYSAAPVAFACSALAADTYTETFAGGVNAGGWTYWSPNETIETAGGNPDNYLHAWELDTFAPQLSTEPGRASAFTGDYRARQVARIGIDLKTFHVDFSAGGRPLTLMLIHDNNTPADLSDDVAAYYRGPNIPLVGEGWKRYDFEVPSHAATLPAGWRTIQLGENSPAPDWSTIITGVRRVQFFYGDPEMFFIFQMWDIGADNISIIEDPLTPAALRNIKVQRGTRLSGTLASILYNDPYYYKVTSQPGDVYHVAETTVRAVSDVLNPANLIIRTETRATESVVQTRIALRNFTTGRWDTVDTFWQPTIDAVRVIDSIANPQDYVRQSDGLIRVRIQMIRALQRGPFQQWIDQVKVSVGE